MHRLGPAAVGALEVAVLDQRHRRVRRAADVVALGVDRHGEVDEIVGGPTSGARVRRGSSAVDAEHEPGRARRADRRGQHAELGLLQLARR